MKRREERIQEFSRLPNRVLIDRICDYPDQKALDANIQFPVGKIAHEIRDNDYRMSQRQRSALTLQFVNHTQAQVTAKEKELEKLPRKEVVDRICGYPDQDKLNYTSAGEKRGIPLGELAEQIRDRSYRVSEAQYNLLYRQFAEVTATETYEMEQSRPRTGREDGLENTSQTEPEITKSYAAYWFALNASIDDPNQIPEINGHLGQYLSRSDVIENLNARLAAANADIQVTGLSMGFTSGSQGEIHLEANGDLTGSSREIQTFLEGPFASEMEGPLGTYINDGIYFEREQADLPLFWGFSYEKGGSLDPDLTLTDADLAELNIPENGLKY